MKRSFLTMAVLGTVSIGTIGSAAADICLTTGTLTQAVGTVMVDKGAGYTPGVIGTSLKNGDKITVQGPGSAVVDFGNDRTLTVPASTTETLRAPGCGAFAMSSPSAIGGPAVGIFGSLALGGAVAAAISASDGNSGVQFFPISP